MDHHLLIQWELRKAASQIQRATFTNIYINSLLHPTQTPLSHRRVRSLRQAQWPKPSPSADLMLERIMSLPPIVPMPNCEMRGKTLWIKKVAYICSARIRHASRKAAYQGGTFFDMSYSNQPLTTSDRNWRLSDAWQSYSSISPTQRPRSPLPEAITYRNMKSWKAGWNRSTHWEIRVRTTAVSGIE